MPVPRTHASSSGAAVSIMARRRKTRDVDLRALLSRRTLPRGTPWDDRAVVLAQRLLFPLPSWLNPPRTEEHWMMLWAAIGQELAVQEPEFGWGKGRKPGSRNRKLQTANLEPSTIRVRRFRAKRRVTNIDGQ
jgi:hypothetical protein